MASKGFSFRTFTSFILAWSFLFLILSGSVLYVAPPGRIANWTRWQLAVLTKEQWQAVHTLTAIVFLVGGMFHLLKFNWKPFLAYIRRRAETGLRFRREIIASSALFLAVLAGTVAESTPFADVMALGTAIRESWEDASRTPPMPHMEELTLRELAGRIQTEPEKLGELLQGLGCPDTRADEPLRQVAESCRKSPAEIYTALSSLGMAATADHVRTAAGSGRGQGFKTLAEVAREYGVSAEDAIGRLAAAGIEARADMAMRDIADRSKKKPYEVIEIIEGNAVR